MLKKLLILLLTAFAITSAFARPTVYMLAPARVDIVIPAAANGAALGAEWIKRAIVNGGRQRKWTVAGERPGVVTLQFSKSHDKNQVVVDVAYDDKGFQIRYVSSVGMMYRQEGELVRIHPYYNKWVDDLGNDIEAAARRQP